MTVRFQSVLGAVALFALTAIPAVYGQQGEDPDLMKQRQTIVDIRSVGKAMHAWLTDQINARKDAKAAEAADPTSVDMSKLPVISREELAKILVPTYLASLPEKDAWGHPYEFHLNVKDPGALTVMALRSAGRDGRFSGDVYEVGGFSPPDYDQDISWVDGYFIRWPEKKQGI